MLENSVWLYEENKTKLRVEPGQKLDTKVRHFIYKIKLSYTSVYCLTAIYPQDIMTCNSKLKHFKFEISTNKRC